MYHASKNVFNPPSPLRKMMKNNQIHKNQHALAKVTPAEAYSCLQVCVFYRIQICFEMAEIAIWLIRKKQMNQTIKQFIQQKAELNKTK